VPGQLLLAASEQQDVFSRADRGYSVPPDAVLTAGGMHTEAMKSASHRTGLRSATGGPRTIPMVTLLRGVIADGRQLIRKPVAGYLASSKRFVTVEGLGVLITRRCSGHAMAARYGAGAVGARGKDDSECQNMSPSKARIT